MGIGSRVTWVSAIAGATVLLACSTTHHKKLEPTAAAAASSKPAPQAGAPTTPQHDVVDHYFGVAVHDPYRWLEQADAPDVRHWIAQENAHTDQVLDAMPERTAIAKRVQKLALTGVQRFGPSSAAGSCSSCRRRPPSPSPSSRRRPGPRARPGSWSIRTSRTGPRSPNYWPSPDGHYVAYGTAEGGSEATTIHVVHVADGKTLPDAMPHAGGGTTPQALAWDADSRGFTYVRLPLPGTVPAPELQFGAALYHHVLGQPATADTLSFGQGLSKVAEYSFTVSDDGKTAILVHFGDGNPDRVYLRSGDAWKRVLGPEANVRAGDSLAHGGAASFEGDRLLVITHQDAPRGQLVSVTADGTPSVVVPQQDWAMNGVYAFKGGFLLAMVSGPAWRLDQYDTSGHRVRSAPLPDHGVGLGDVATSEGSDQVLLTYSGWSFPERWAKYDTHHGDLETVFQMTAAADYSKVQSRVLTAVSKDGTHVPVTVLSLAGTRADGHRPDDSHGLRRLRHLPPAPLCRLLSRVARARRRLRGREHSRWRGVRRGLARRAACSARSRTASTTSSPLPRHSFTRASPTRATWASSAARTAACSWAPSSPSTPHAFRAVVSFVGIYDMLRSELWPNGRYNVSEYGTVARKADFEWLYAYSPLQHVKAGEAYPAVLLETGVNDPRVAPWQSRKLAAALQAATSSSQPILLLTRMNEGHGVTASFSQRVGNTAAALAFFAHELGLPPSAS